MNYLLFEQWLSELVVKDHKQQIHKLVECIQEDPALQFLIGMQELYPALVHEQIEVRCSAINGLLIGVCLAEAWRRAPDKVENGLQGFLDNRAKLRGENIIDFFNERTKKK